MSLSTEELLDSTELESATLDQLSWYALQTRPRFEKKVTTELQEKGVEAFLPAQTSLRQWSDRRRMIERPLFPGYVFVKSAATLDARVTILRTNGVSSFVGVRGIGTPIPNEEIIAIRKVLEEKIPFSLHPFLRVGQSVRIRGGGLDGVKGVLAGIRGDQSLIISVELIQRSIAMRVSGYQVEPV
jgi:transcription termination/antitermination protein NusG